MNIYLEIGEKKTFACAVDWPGWSRSGTDEAQAQQALLDSAARYARAVQPAGLGFQPLKDITGFEIVERLPGDKTTDFGAPSAIPAADSLPVSAEEHDRFLALLDAYWAGFLAAYQAGQGKELRKGPRGGGRELDGILDHTQQAELSYLKRLGGNVDKHAWDSADLEGRLPLLREAAASGLAAAVRGELPERGPRGGIRWTPRYYVRRSGWHILDHIWEIEDRIV
jgi:hypothetical protein